MKISTFRISIAAILLLGMVTACQKSANDNNSNKAITRENLAGSYKLTSFKISVGGSPEQDYSLSDCQKDDVYELKLDSTANYIDAGVKCSPPGDDTGRWTLNDHTITVTAGTQLTGTIQSFDGHIMVITGQQSMSGITGNYKITLTKQ